ncbi:helix-turn-helix domain-containing protein [Streptomyces sp. NPDC051956]|uniref:helix-turn-helix domain-containing protein n=1 Tax=Streptomyces sp. NPDC051956 TaxID=3365677 RepID=UPI0037D1F47F
MPASSMSPVSCWTPPHTCGQKKGANTQVRAPSGVLGFEWSSQHLALRGGMFEIRKNRAKTLGGRRMLVREREECFRLVDLGYGNTEACRRVGINERTGREWRNGRMAKQRFRRPVHPAPIPASPGRYLTQADRLHIADRLRESATAQAIATELGRSPSTFSREIRRNGIPLRKDASRWAYRPTQPRSVPRPADHGRSSRCRTPSQ